MYWANEIKCRKYTKGFFHYGCVVVASFFTALIHALGDIYDGNTDTSAWDLPLGDGVLPFGKESVFGWLVYWFFHFNVNFTYVVCTTLPMTHFACYCHYIVASCNHFDLMIASVRNDCEQIRNEKNRQKHPKMWRDAVIKLQKAIKVHTNIYE